MTDTTTVATETTAKYRLEPEGNLFRIIALREMVAHEHGGPYVFPGERGGLVAGQHVLAQSGTCWIDATCRIEDPASRIHDHAFLFNVQSGPATRLDVAGHASVGDSVFNGTLTHIYQNARVENAQQESGKLYIHEHASIYRGIFNGNVQLKGDVSVGACEEMFEEAPRIGFKDDNNFVLLRSGAIPGNAWITHVNQTLTLQTPWGPATAFRASDGVSVLISIGCQRVETKVALTHLANRTAHGDQELFSEIVDPFWEMVEAMRATPIWALHADAAPTIRTCNECGQPMPHKANPDNDDDD